MNYFYLLSNEGKKLSGTFLAEEIVSEIWAFCLVLLISVFFLPKKEKAGPGGRAV